MHCQNDLCCPCSNPSAAHLPLEKPPRTACSKSRLSRYSRWNWDATRKRRWELRPGRGLNCHDGIFGFLKSREPLRLRHGCESKLSFSIVIIQKTTEQTLVEYYIMVWLISRKNEEKPLDFLAFPILRQPHIVHVFPCFLDSLTCWNWGKLHRRESQKRLGMEHEAKVTQLVQLFDRLWRTSKRIWPKMIGFVELKQSRYQYQSDESKIIWICTVESTQKIQ